MSGAAFAEVGWVDGAPRSTAFDDIYYAVDGLAEARAVFLEGCDLPRAWEGRGRFVVAELGFGTGLNVAALLHLWRRTRPSGAVLHVFSVERHPMRREDAERALAAFPEIDVSARALLDRWPGGARGFERLEFPESGAILDIATQDVAEALDSWTGRADAWFLDGFAPAKNPEMWSDPVLERVAARSAPGARLASFTVAGAVRSGLEARGFDTRKAPGHGRKRERLEARLRTPARAARAPDRDERVAIIGGGIAGASLARAFARLGARAVLIDPRPGGGASGNPAALVSPRLDVGHGSAARLYAQAFARAVDLYAREAGDAVVARGVVRLGDDGDAARKAKLAASPLLRRGALAQANARDVEARLGEPAGEGLWIADALTLDPARLLQAWLPHADIVQSEVAGIEFDGGAWKLRAGDGAVIGEARAVCLAAGEAVAAWLDPSVIEPVLGQASWTRDVGLAGAAASWGGYAVPLAGGGLLFGATHERGRGLDAPSDERNWRNLATLRSRLPALAASVAHARLASRTGVRAATPDRLPLAGRVEGRPGLFVLGGLGGRGFTSAPLLAEHVAAEATGAPSPLPRALAEAVDPARFARRAASRARAAGAHGARARS